MNLLNRNDAAGASTFPSYSVWQFPLRWNKYKTKKLFIKKLGMFYTSHHSCAKKQQKLPKLLWKGNTVAISLHYWDDLLLVTLDSKHSLQFFNCMAYIRTISLTLPLFRSLSFLKSARDNLCVRWMGMAFIYWSVINYSINIV